MDAPERTPILVGAAAVQQREEDPSLAREPLELMIDALKAAAEDAGHRGLLERATSIRAPRGFWSYPDPCRMIAERFGANNARTEVGEIGVLQTTFFGRAARDIANGSSDIVLVTGGEARYRSRCAGKRGAQESYAAQEENVRPDEVLRPATDVLDDLEVARGLAMPVNQYSMIENALRADDGISVDEHRNQVAELMARFSAVAAANENAWNREGYDAETIRGGAGNRMLAFPYTRLHTSQWNVDQAAGFIFTSVGIARQLGIAEDRWLFPHAVVDSNLMLALSRRRDPHRCAGFAKAAGEVQRHTGTAIASAKYLELYSCFPSAVRVQMREMGIAPDRTVTVTGGMAYAGGPLNNFSFQALAKMSDILRADRGNSGVVTAVSGVLTKQGVSLWSTEPPAQEFHFADVSDATEAASPAVELVDDATGDATVRTYTVLYPSAEGVLVALVDLEDGRRTIVATGDQELARAATQQEMCGRRVRISGPQQLELT